VIVVSDQPWCFVARSDQILVDQVSDDFSTGLEILLNYLVICFESFYYVLVLRRDLMKGCDPPWIAIVYIGEYAKAPGSGSCICEFEEEEGSFWYYWDIEESRENSI
jgi:hypothetical protein